jgi:alanyl-tRNA synthetase
MELLLLSCTTLLAFPIDLTQLIAREQNLSVDMEEFAGLHGAAKEVVQALQRQWIPKIGL